MNKFSQRRLWIARAGAAGLAAAAGPRFALAQPQAGHDHAQHGRAADIGADCAQPLVALAQRVAQALRDVGEPLPDADLARLTQALADPARAAAAVDAVLAPRVLVVATLSPEGRVSVRRGPAIAQLVQGGWRSYLVQVDNPARVPGVLNLNSPQAARTHDVQWWTDAERPTGGRPDALPPAALRDRWLAIEALDGAPIEPQLANLPRDWRIVQLYSRDGGVREASLVARLDGSTEDLGQRGRVPVRFAIAPAREVRLSITEADGRTPCTVCLEVRDAQGRLLPTPNRRLLPDLHFQPQVYRAHGQTLTLPPGRYQVRVQRGPETIAQNLTLDVPATSVAQWKLRVQRWLDTRALDWFSGDHHVHAAGCSHFISPDDGVAPEVMLPQLLGEDLATAGVLNWQPGWDAQRKHFTGRDHAVSTPDARLRYDMEVSGFPSSHGGHLCLLKLKTLDYPGARHVEDWPSWNGPILRWAREQGGVTGYAHSGFGLWAGTSTLPNFAMPPFNGIGANDCIVHAAEDLVDFIGVGDTIPAAELNLWYQLLNTGLRLRIAGETDWPCITDAVVGGARSQVYLLPSGAGLNYGDWCEGLRAGRSYVTEGRAHLLDLQVGMGAQTAALGAGQELLLAAPGHATVSARFAGWLQPQPDEASERIRNERVTEQPLWHVERARVPGTRSVVVELLVNGHAVGAQLAAADGSLQTLRFDAELRQSCWVALRVASSAHTNPVFVTIAGRPIRDARSARWCLEAVDACWRQKSLRIRASELEAARASYEAARVRYRQLLAEAAV